MCRSSMETTTNSSHQVEKNQEEEEEESLVHDMMATDDDNQVDNDIYVAASTPDLVGIHDIIDPIDPFVLCNAQDEEEQVVLDNLFDQLPSLNVDHHRQQLQQHKLKVLDTPLIPPQSLASSANSDASIALNEFSTATSISDDHETKNRVSIPWEYANDSVETILASATTTGHSGSSIQAVVAGMRETLYKMAIWRPVNLVLDPGNKPKRRNVKISKDPQTVAARHRRERISTKIRILQRLVPGGTKMDTASMLDEAIHYVKYLKSQVQAMELFEQTTAATTVDPHSPSSSSSPLLIQEEYWAVQQQQQQHHQELQFHHHLHQQMEGGFELLRPNISGY